MSAITATALAEILSKPSIDRLEFEVRLVCGWLRENVKYFKKITDEVLQTLVVECSVEKVDQNKVVIWEGEEGDRMYILLSGNLNVYRLNEVNKEALLENIETVEDTVVSLFPEKIRNMPLIEDTTVLGQCLATLEPGKIFGEVALIEKCTRSATIFAPEDCKIVVIPRELYNATVASVLEEEFQMKLNFVESVSFFSCCSQKHKKQLLMALESHSCDYPTQIIKQGDQVQSMVFLMSGEIRLTCDPYSHDHQFDKLSRSWKSDYKQERDLSTVNNSSHGGHKGSIKHKTTDICLLGPSTQDSSNKPCIGDLELLLNIPTYFCSATATSHCVLLTLHSRHYERILLKRNPQSIDIMMTLIKKRINFWSQRLSPIIPLFTIIDKRIQTVIESSKGVKSLPSPLETSTNSAENIYQYTPPSRGALVDPFGPGTVFYYIRNQYKLREQTKEHNSNKTMKKMNRKGTLSTYDKHAHGGLQRHDTKTVVRVENFSKDVGYSGYYDNHTKELEKRIKDFLKICNTSVPAVVEPMSDIVEKIPNMKYPKRGNLVVLKPTESRTSNRRNGNLSTEALIKVDSEKD